MKKVLYFIGFLWMLPINLLFWIWIYFYLYRKGAVEEISLQDNFGLRWDIANDSFFYKRMKGWFGFVLGTNMIVIDDEPYDKFKQHLAHEDTHIFQNYIFGILFYPVYFIMSGFIYLFLKNLHPYLDNPFERWARKQAGQQVTISKENWPKGGRWIFW